MSDNIEIITRFEHAFRAGDHAAIDELCEQDFMGIPATGQTIRVQGVNFYRLKNGRVTDIWAQFDGVGLMQQLGAIPA